MKFAVRDSCTSAMTESVTAKKVVKTYNVGTYGTITYEMKKNEMKKKRRRRKKKVRILTKLNEQWTTIQSML